MVKWGKLFKPSSKQPAGAALVAPTPAGASGARVQGAKAKLDEAEELLLQRQALLERQIAAQHEKARDFTRQGNKTAALAALKKKKLLEAQLEQVESNVLRINEQQLMLENSATTALTVATLQQATLAAQAITREELDAATVDRVLDDITEQHEEMRQISDALGMPLGAAADLDEDELLGELEGLEEEQEAADLLEASPPPQRIAAVYAGVAAPAKQAASKTAEELELEQLQAELLAA